jgi:hypothetical protein
MSALSCPIWNTPATESRESDGDKIYVFSHRAGGLYSITGSAVPMVQHLSDQHKMLLTTWLCDQRAAGNTDPLITTDVLDEIKLKRPLPLSPRIDRALLFFNGLRLGDTATIFDGDFSAADPSASLLAANTESADKDDLLALFSVLGQLALVNDSTAVIGRYEFTPTAQGWMRIEELTRIYTNTAQAFVAMWFNDTTKAAYVDGIAPAIRKCGYEPMRIDNKEHANKIDDEIIAEIRRSRFVVADFTCEKDKVRGGVYYEAGFARGLGIPVIWTCHQGSIGDLHFDTRQYNHLVWETPDGLRHSLEARIGAVIGDGPLRKR